MVTPSPLAEPAAPAGLPRPKVLIVDDDAALLRAYARMLSADGYDVETRPDGETAVEAIRAASYDVILSDIDMPRMSGVALLERVRAHDHDVPVVLVTGSPSLETAIAAIEHGVLRYVTKPVEAGRLRSIISDAVRHHRLARAKRSALDMMGDADRRAVDKAGLVKSFDSALEGLWIAYQPIVSWSRRSLFGYEALLRSREPALPHPGAVLDAAEQLGRIRDLGRAVRERAAEAADRIPADTLLFVNLHTQELLDDDLFDRARALARHAGRVVLEITERASLHPIRDVRDRVARLRDMGFRIAIDDLGAGYAGLTSFSLLDPHVVKLDMALVRNVHQQPTKLTLVRTMVAMCRELGVEVVAEGIECAEERDAMAWAGCDLLQGYLFAKPGPAFPEVCF